MIYKIITGLFWDVRLKQIKMKNLIKKIKTFKFLNITLWTESMLEIKKNKTMIKISNHKKKEVY